MTMTLKGAMNQAELSISDQLRKALEAVRKKLPKLKIPDSPEFDEVGHLVLLGLLEDKKGLAALRAVLNAYAAAGSKELTRIDADEWLTTEAMAKRMGFSRPYAIALIDAGEFKGDVSKSAGGHRRVRASAVERWMSSQGVNFPLTSEQSALLDEVEGSDFFVKPAKLSKKKADEIMRDVEARRAESRTHRPVRK